MKRFPPTWVIIVIWLVIAVAIPSFFAGMGGMSEFSNMITFGNWVLGYTLFFVVMLTIGIGTFLLIKRIEKFWKT